MELSPPAPRHVELWTWADNLRPGKRPEPFVAVWPRGSGKSTTAELIAVYCGATDRRKYCWYVSGTQDLADLHVDAVASLIESESFAGLYPSMASRKIGKYGNPKGWRRNRLRCGNGFTVDALGLDVGVRGMKVEGQRPDLIILDDVDDQFASHEVVQKTIQTITGAVLPAGSQDVAVLCIQNLVSAVGFFGRMVSGEADYLLDRIMSGPHPAIVGLAVDKGGGRYKILGGVPTWGGQDLMVCQQQMDSWGYTAFLREAQHEIRNDQGMFGQVEFKYVDPKEAFDYVRTVVVVDPAVTSMDKSDSHGISVASLTDLDDVHIRYGVEAIMTPAACIRKAILLALDHGSREVHVEVNQGGDMWEYLFNNVVADLRKEGAIEDAPTFFMLKATSGTGGKVERAQTLLADMERGAVYLVPGTNKTVENALLRFPQEKPYDLVDATVYAHGLLREGWTTLLI